MFMLFSGLACFSPSVVPTIRKLWVKNGGTLTHTDDDFRRANYFFCEGMNDPWLNELLSRCLIVRLPWVRHAAWVTLCVAEDFCMPIAPYTLDDGFDLTKIRILEPPGTRKAAQTDAAVIDSDVSTNSIKVPVDILSKTKAISRKRPFDNVYDSSTHEEEERRRPLRKKARIDVHALVFPELYDHRPCMGKPRSTTLNIDNALDKKSAKPDIDVVPGPHHFTIFPKSSRNANRAVRQRFLSQIRRTPVDDPNDTSALNPFSLFWNDLLETHLSEDVTAPLTLSVDDLLRAPRVRATIFAVNTDYLGKTFVDSGPAILNDQSKSD